MKYRIRRFKCHEEAQEYFLIEESKWVWKSLLPHKEWTTISYCFSEETANLVLDDLLMYDICRY